MSMKEMQDYIAMVQTTNTPPQERIEQEGVASGIDSGKNGGDCETDEEEEPVVIGTKPGSEEEEPVVIGTESEEDGKEEEGVLTEGWFV